MEIKKDDFYRPVQLKSAQARQLSQVERIQEALKRPDCLGFEAYENEQRIGFALVRKFAEGEFFLWNFVIEPVFQGQGKGKIFLNLLLEKLQQDEGAGTCTVTYKTGNDIARRLYLSAGFEIVDCVDSDEIHEVNLKIEF